MFLFDLFGIVLAADELIEKKNAGAPIEMQQDIFSRSSEEEQILKARKNNRRRDGTRNQTPQIEQKLEPPRNASDNNNKADDDPSKTLKESLNFNAVTNVLKLTKKAEDR